MHSFRLRYIVLGLLIYIQNAYCRTCNSDFEDLGSHAILADVIFEGLAQGTSTFSAPSEPVRYNTTFSVKKVLKGSLPKSGKKKRFNPVVVGVFGDYDAENCRTHVELQKSYIVFLKLDASSSNSDPPATYTVSHFPQETSKKNLRIIRDHICPDCAEKPTCKMKPKKAKGDIGKRLNLNCKIAGKPKPLVKWYHWEKEIHKSKSYHIKSKSRRSQLRIKRFHPRNAGTYSCVAYNAAGSATCEATISSAELQVTSTLSTQFTTSPTTSNAPTEENPNWAVKCEKQTYCLNNGTCYRIPQIGTRFCRCTEKHEGPRCERKSLIVGLAIETERQNRQFDRSMTIMGLVIGALVLGSIFILSYCLAKKKRESYFRKQQWKQSQKEKFSNGLVRGEGLNGPLPNTTFELRNHNFMQPPPAVERQDSGTQTDDNMSPLFNAPSMNHYQNGNHRASRGSYHEAKPNGLPRQNTAPACFPTARDPQSPSRPRLSGISQTPDFEEHRRKSQSASQPPPGENTQIVNAMIESDREQDDSHGGSPGEISVTESAHDSDVRKIGKNELFDLGKSPAMIDFDQQSDYDNQQASDLEVNIESEADVPGIETSGDEINGERGKYEDSSDSETDSSSDNAEEQALFQNLKARPRVPSLSDPSQKPPHHEHSQHQPAATNNFWDDYSNNSPNFAMNDYNYHPYMDDRDLIENRHLIPSDNLNNHSVNKSSPRYESPPPEIELYDSDPDATAL